MAEQKDKEVVASQNSSLRVKYEAVVPPSGLYFKLLSKESGKVIMSGKRFGDVAIGAYEDQYWCIDTAKGDYFRLKNKKSGKVIVSGKRFGDFKLGGEFEDQFWTLDSIKGEWFRLMNKDCGKVIISGKRFGDYKPGADSPDQYFKFAYEPYEIVSLTFDNKNGRITEQKPYVIAERTVINNTDTEQDVKFSTYTTGMSLFTFYGV